MKISKQARRDARQLFRSCMVNGVLDENRVRQAVQPCRPRTSRAVTGDPFAIPRLVKLEVARRTARVESATPLVAANAGADPERSDRQYGAGLELSLSRRIPALIGGLRIQVGSDLYDGSVQGTAGRNCRKVLITKNL